MIQVECPECGIDMELLHPPSDHLFECVACGRRYSMNKMTRELVMVKGAD